MNSLAIRIPNLPRPSWAWARAASIGLMVASASLAVFATLRDPYWKTALYGGLYPLILAAALAIPGYMIVWLGPPLRRGWVVPAAALACALPPLIVAVTSDFPPSHDILLRLAPWLLAGSLGGLAFWAFRNSDTRGLRVAFWISLALVYLPIVGWLIAWRVPAPDWGSSWEAANPSECALMERATREMAFDRLPSHPPLMGISKSGGPCDWAGSGLSLQRVTMSEFRAAVGDDLTGRYIEHIGVSRPSYSLLRLRAIVDVSHRYGPEGGDGFYCTFRRGLTGWNFVSCERAWVS